MVSPYLPHAIYALAVTSISINVVNAKKVAEEDRTRIQTRESILKQIREHLRSPKPVPWEEVERLKKLARPAKADSDDRILPEVKLSWTDVFYGRKMPKEEDELSEWDKRDLEKLKSAFNEEKP